MRDTGFPIIHDGTGHTCPHAAWHELGRGCACRCSIHPSTGHRPVTGARPTPRSIALNTMGAAALLTIDVIRWAAFTPTQLPSSGGHAAPERGPRGGSSPRDRGRPEAEGGKRPLPTQGHDPFREFMTRVPRGEPFSPELGTPRPISPTNIMIFPLIKEKHWTSRSNPSFYIVNINIIFSAIWSIRSYFLKKWKVSKGWTRQ